MTISQKTFDEIYDLLEHRLNQVGSIKAIEVYTICKGKTTHSYFTIINVFRSCMDTMVEQRKAYKVCMGRWEITKPNDPLAWLDSKSDEIKNLIR